MASWLFGTPKSNLPDVTPLQAQRSKQIDSLRNLNPNVAELKRDEEYRIAFTCGTNQVSFTIFLPPEFPQAKPVIRVSPPMRHRLVDENMQIVYYLPLVNFNVQTDLGRMIQGLILDFGKSPMLIQQEPTQQRGAPVVPPYQQFMPHPPPATQHQPIPSLQQPLPGPSQHPMHPTPPYSQQTPPHSHQAPPLLHQTIPHPHQAPPNSHQPSPPQHSSHMPLPHPGGMSSRPPAPMSAQYVMVPSSSAGMQSFPSASSMSSSSSSSISTTTAANKILEAEPNMPVPGMSGVRGLHDGHFYSMPPIPPSFEDSLKDLSHHQLEELLEDEDKLDAVFTQLPQLSKMHKDRTELYQSCEEIAKLNLSYQPELDRLRRELEATVNFRNEVKNSFDMKCLQQQSQNEQCSLQHLLDNMTVMAADAEHQSDDMAEKFLEDKLSLDEFLKQFSEQRRLLHIRRVKEEKVQHLLQPGQGRGY